MRDIKFRAWDKKEKVMHQRVHEWYDTLGERDGEPRQEEDSFGAVLEGTMSMDSDVLRYDVMQYTGLKDVNGVEIYEGDVIEWHDCDYPDGHTALKSTHQSVVEFAGGAYQILSSMPSEEFEVIGNIHKNRELLEDKS